MSWRDAPLYVEAHGLARWLLQRTETWPAERGLRERLSGASCELLEAVSLALTFPRERVAHLGRADRAIVCVRVLLRLARDLGWLSPGGVRFACGRLRLIGRMVGGWTRRVERARALSEGEL